MPEGTANDHRFHRPPRAFPAAVPAEEIVIATPPPVPTGTGQSWLYVLFPVVGSATMFVYAVIYKNPLFFYIAGLLVAVTLGFAILLRWSQHRSGKLSARRQRRLYREHLAKREAQLRDVATLQSHAADRLYPDPPKLWSSVLRRDGLWERRPGDDDFLTVRVGRGPVAHAGRPRVELGSNPLAEHMPELVEEATALVDRWAVLARQPVTVDLAEHPVVSILGPRDRGRDVARAIAAQLAGVRSPADVQLAAAFPDAGDAAWEWMKWLPHARPASAAAPDGSPRPLLARGHAGLAALLDEQVAPRLEHLRILDAAQTGLRAAKVEAPRLVLIVDGYAPLDPRARLPLLREVLIHGDRLRVSVIVLVDDAADEPAEAAARVRLAERGAASLELAGPTGGAASAVETDALAAGAAEAVARALAPLRLVDDGAGGGSSGSRSLLELLGLPSASAIDPATDWAARPRTLALRAPIGVTAEGQLVELDLKQAAEGGMGPHGLVIGATGSGKSELLRTLIAGLAINHSPEELAFVFVDFKGGAALAELAELPHTAGLITNLQRDLSLIDRMHDALRGEQERRQSILRDAGNLDDVLQYRRRRAEDPTMPALPDLVVLIDEFGELLAARPDFIDLFVAIGRVGRSLGIHLLFSSQRFEEGKLRGLESHLRYRICLRTYSALESKGVLGTPDAALLPPEPGLGFLKVDTSIYERFRAALVSSTREASPQGAGQRITTFDAAAAPLAQADAAANVTATGASVATGMREVVTALRTAASPVHQIWLPPLEPLLALGAVPQAGARHDDRPELRATLGTTDLPLEQRREPLELDFTGATGHLAIVGAPQTGKSTALRTLALALAREHGPRAVQFAAIDLGGGTLRALAGLPHLSAVAGKSDRDLARLIVSRMRAELRTREALFRRHGLDDIADARERRAQGATPEEGGVADLFLLIDGWAQLRRDHPDLDLEIEELIGTGLSYGIHVVVTASRWAEMRPSVADGLASRLELRLNDPLESEIDRRANEALPADRPGRALTIAAVETQIALPRLDGQASAASLGEATAAAARTLAGRWAHEPLAPRMRALPPVVAPHEVDAARGGSGLALTLGIEEVHHHPVVVDLLGADPHFLVLGDGESGRTNLLRAFVLAAAGSDDPPRISIVDPRRTLTDLATLPQVEAYVTTPSRTAELATRLATEANARLPQAGDDPLAAAREAGQRDLVIVDDYDLLVGPEGNPLAPLTGLISHGRDAGLHVVVARRVAGTTRAAFESFFQRLTELRTPGLMLSGEPAEGPLLDGYRARPFPPGRGLLIRRGQPAAVVQTVLVDPPMNDTGAQPAAARTA